MATERSDHEKDAKRSADSPGRPKGLAMAVLACLVVAVFHPMAGFEFVDLDTPLQVTQNEHIRGLTAQNLKHIFTSWCIASYYPVRTLTYTIDYQIWGLNPAGFKLTNGLIHLVNVYLVFWLILRLFRHESARESRRDSWWDVGCATFGAGLFAIHPVVVEPLAWVPGREELLMTLGALGCFHFHMLARRLDTSSGRTWKATTCYVVAAICCAAACLSNAVGAVIPFLVVAWDVLTIKTRKFWRILYGTGVLWIIGATTIVLKRIGSSGDAFVPEIGALSIRRLWVVVDVFWLNLKTLVWPTGLSIDYPRAKPVTFADVGVICGLITGCLICVLLWKSRRRKQFVFGVAWFALALAPTAQIIPHHMDRADRFLYLPLVGLVAAVAMGLRPLGNLIKGRLAAVLATTTGIACLVVPCIESARHIQTWRNSLTMWKNCVDLDPHNSLANWSFADHLSDEGRFDQAIPYYKRALALDPDCVDALNNYALRLATCHIQQLRDYDLAIRLAGRACELTEGIEPYRHVLALAHMNHGTVLKRDGQYVRAIESYEHAARADPDYEVPLFNLALLLATCPDDQLREPDRAVGLAEQACGLVGDPNPLQLSILADVYAEVGRLEDAVAVCETAIGVAQTTDQAEWTAQIRVRLERYREQISPKTSKN